MIHRRINAPVLLITLTMCIQVVFKCPVESRQCDSEPACAIPILKLEEAKWKSAGIYFIIYTVSKGEKGLWWG